MSSLKLFCQGNQNGVHNQQRLVQQEICKQDQNVQHHKRQDFPTFTVENVQKNQEVGDQCEQIEEVHDTGAFHIEKLQQNNVSSQIHEQKKIQPTFSQPTPAQDNLQTSSINNDIECQQFQFQVVVHKIDSKLSIPQNQEQYQIVFTKSQLEIPIEVGEGEIQQKTEEAKGYVNIWEKDRAEENDDVYVRMLEEKWAKREEKQGKKMDDSVERESQADIKRDISDPLLFLQQLCKVSSSTSNDLQTIANSSTISKVSQKSAKQDLIKKAGFIIKKLKDDRSSYSTLNPRPLKTSKQPRTILQNKSQLLNLKKQPKHHRLSKKHVSNLESASNNSQRIQRLRENKIKNVQYEIFLGNQVQKMSQILQDRCYNSFVPVNKEKDSHVKVKDDSVERQNNGREESCNKVRKIIKRSPYGILELQVKDNRSQAKITNLRILKPKEMVRLKKIPKLITKGKENLFQ